MGAITTVTGVR
ncbi:hypothetical protein OXX59_010243, partial [Metschnikowia pulcherrima]